jgi:hypothetical protein
VEVAGAVVVSVGVVSGAILRGSPGMKSMVMKARFLVSSY